MEKERKFISGDSVKCPSRLQGEAVELMHLRTGVWNCVWVMLLYTEFSSSMGFFGPKYLFLAAEMSTLKRYRHEF
jgi:hypothetical protein